MTPFQGHELHHSTVECLPRSRLFAADGFISVKLNFRCSPSMTRRSVLFPSATKQQPPPAAGSPRERRCRLANDEPIDAWLGPKNAGDGLLLAWLIAGIILQIVLPLRREGREEYGKNSRSIISSMNVPQKLTHWMM